MQILNALMADIDCLEPLCKWTNDINIFQILRLDRTEIRHSNMLAWLISPDGVHGLGNKFLKKMLIYATNGTNIAIMNGLTPIDIDLMEFSDAVIYREAHHIDILLVSEQNRLVFAIENKIGTQEHDDQLNRYRELLQKKYPSNYHFILLYLSPEGSAPSDTENWVSMSYDFVLEELTNLLNIYRISEKAHLYIQDYMNAIRRNVVEDRELKELCRKIYYKHKEAFDLIFENLPDTKSEITRFLFNYLKENEERFDITVWGDAPSTSSLRFTPHALVEQYGHLGNGEWYHNANLIGFEIRISDDGLPLYVIIGPSEHQPYRQALLDAAVKSGWKIQGKKLTDKWKTIKKIHLYPKYQAANAQLYTIDDICEILKAALENFFANQVDEIITALSGIEC